MSVRRTTLRVAVLAVTLGFGATLMTQYALAAPAKKAATKSPFSGTRQLLLLPKNSEATLGVLKDGRAGLSEAFGRRDLFVLTEVRPGRYWIRTAKLTSGGEPYCLDARYDPARAVGTLVAAACDSSDRSQLFRFRKVGESNGKPTYTIRTGGDRFIVQDPDGDLNPGPVGTGTGIVVAQIGEGTADIDTPFVLADKGPARLPALD